MTKQKGEATTEKTPEEHLAEIGIGFIRDRLDELRGLMGGQIEANLETRACLERQAKLGLETYQRIENRVRVLESSVALVLEQKKIRGTAEIGLASTIAKHTARTSIWTGLALAAFFVLGVILV